MGDIGGAIAGIATAIIGLAIVAVLVSQNAQTSSVIQSAASGFGNVIGTAVGPVTGSGGMSGLGTGGVNLSYPGSGMLG